MTNIVLKRFIQLVQSITQKLLYTTENMLPNDNISIHRAVNNQDVIKMSDRHRNVVIR